MGTGWRATCGRSPRSQAASWDPVPRARLLPACPGGGDRLACRRLTHSPPPPPPPSGVVPAGACLEESAAARPVAGSARSWGPSQSPPGAERTAGRQAGDGGVRSRRTVPPPPGAWVRLPPVGPHPGELCFLLAASLREAPPLLQGSPPARSSLAGPRRTPPQWPEEQLFSQPSQPPFLFPSAPTVPGLLGSFGWALKRGKRLGSPRRRLLPPPPCGGGRSSRLGGHRSG